MVNRRNGRTSAKSSARPRKKSRTQQAATAEREAPVRVRLQTDERRSQLLELGRALFNERPYDEIAIDDIAAAAKVSKGLLYHYFPSKRAFFVEAVRVGAAHMLALTEPPPADLPPVDRLRVSLEAYLDYVEQNARAYTSLFRSGLGVDPEVLEVLEATRGAIVRRITTSLGVDDPPPVVRVGLRGWIGMVEAASVDWLERRDLSRDQLRDLLGAALQATLAFAVGTTVG